MSRIPATTMNDAPEATRPLLAALKQRFGMVPNLFATIGQSPEALDVLLTSIDKLGHGLLPPREVELVNVYTSELNGCAYCVSAHTALGKMAGLSVEEIEGVRSGRGTSAREAAILRLVTRVVRTGGSGAGTELAGAREAGLTDREIIEVLAHVALKAFTNAVAQVAETEIDFPKPARLPRP